MPFERFANKHCGLFDSPVGRESVPGIAPHTFSGHPYIRFFSRRALHMQRHDVDDILLHTCQKRLFILLELAKEGSSRHIPSSSQSNQHLKAQRACGHRRSESVNSRSLFHVSSARRPLSQKELMSKTLPIHSCIPHGVLNL